ncbi:MAG: DedA family protein [Alphaproteobacteria bacterium]
MESWLADIEAMLRGLGLPGLFAGVFIESFGMPVPGETMIILFSAFAATGQINIVAVALTAFVAAVLGDNLGYAIGRFGGRPLIVRHGARFGITHARMDKVEAIIQRRGPIIVAFARFVVLLRQLNGLAAGAAGMHWLAFLIANVIGAALWVGTWSTLAYEFGSELHVIPYLLRHLGWVAAIGVPLLLLAIAGGWWWFRRRRRRRSNGPPAD